RTILIYKWSKDNKDEAGRTHPDILVRRNMQLTINPYFASGRSYEDFERDENENNETKKKVKVKKAGKVVGLTYVDVVRNATELAKHRATQKGGAGRLTPTNYLGITPTPERDHAESVTSRYTQNLLTYIPSNGAAPLASSPFKLSKGTVTMKEIDEYLKTSTPVKPGGGGITAGGGPPDDSDSSSDDDDDDEDDDESDEEPSRGAGAPGKDK